MVESACDLSTQEAKEQGQEFKARHSYIASPRPVRVTQRDPEKKKGRMKRKGGVAKRKRERWKKEGREGREKEKALKKADKEEEEKRREE